MNENSITVSITANVPLAKAWASWTTPEDIMQWNIPFKNWHTPLVLNDLKEGGTFLYRMEEKDGPSGFDYAGKYDTIVLQELIESTGVDGRRTSIKFTGTGNTTTIKETFEPQMQDSIEIQKDFCQSVLNKFKEFVEGKNI